MPRFGYFAVFRAGWLTPRFRFEQAGPRCGQPASRGRAGRCGARPLWPSGGAQRGSVAGHSPPHFVAAAAGKVQQLASVFDRVEGTWDGACGRSQGGHLPTGPRSTGEPGPRPGRGREGRGRTAFAPLRGGRREPGGSSRVRAGAVLLVRAGNGLRAVLFAFAGRGCGCARESVTLDLPAAADETGVGCACG